MEIGAVMIDAHEAIKGLDGYAEALLGLNTLLNLFEEKSDEHQSLLVQIKEKQTDGRWIALEIMKDIHNVGTKSDRSGNLTGISAAIQRYVAADDQANEVLMKAEKATRPNEVVEALRRFRVSAGLVSE
jgi:UDP-N-acetylmuramyl pentapeptide synthase